ncbi:MAG: phosphoribosylaminoimidazole synthetase [Campylobacterales bacterium]|nr:phosphoribosylaminoimidazole synthetase [Campylobacterales bacterium]
MCVERVQRLMMVAFLAAIFYFVSVASNGIALILISFMALMLLVWALIDFCPSVWILSKFLPKCWGKR